ncbi:MAG: sugar ABC transporter permease [Anaerolineae bacterium]|nr:sugar ABC transporter permease [Anaerolineae bacterium]
MTSKHQTASRLASAGSGDEVRYGLFRRLEPYLLMLPALVVISLFFFGPALYNVTLSFQRITLFELAKGGQWVGLDNYTAILRDRNFVPLLVNTLFWLTGVTVALRLVLGFGFALLLNSAALRRWRLTGLARSLVLIPWVTPPVVAVAVWQWLVHPRYGAINQLMMDARLIESGIPFLSSASTAWYVIVAIFVWRELPFVVISLLAGMQAIPDELYEAARIDGCNSFNLLRFITIPILRPIFVVVTLLTIIWSFNNFIYVWLTTHGGPGNATQVLTTQMYLESFVNYRMGLGAAVGVLMSVLMTVFAIVYFSTTLKRSIGPAR